LIHFYKRAVFLWKAYLQVFKYLSSE